MDDDIGNCLAFYFNSIFGAIMWNSYGQSTQAGRATIQVNATAGLPCPNFVDDSPEAERARRIAKEKFNKLSMERLEPFAFCFRDKNRHEIDNIVAEMLGLDPTDEDIQEMLKLYRHLFCSEPNVNGRQQRIMKAVTEYHNQA